MPWSRPPAAQPPPGREDFEQLLHGLSAEFERLRQRNLELTYLNSQLRSKSSLGKAEEDSWLTPGETQDSWKSWVAKEEAAQDCSAWRDKLQTSPFFQVCQNSSVSEERSRQPSAEQFDTKRVFQVSKLCTEAAAVQARPSGASKGVQRVQPKNVRNQESLGVVSKCATDLCVSTASPCTEGGLIGAKSSRSQRLYELFRELDSHGKGKLCYSDLVHVLERADEPVLHGGLTNLLRIFNGLDPLELDEGGDSPSPPEGSEHLGIDFQAFMQLMDETITFGHLDLSSAECLKSLRRACHDDGRPVGAIKTYANPEISHKLTLNAQGQEMGCWMETVPTIVILLNTLVIGLSADYESYESTWDVLEAIFVAFYCFEFAAKVRLYGCIGYFTCHGKWWNMFDFTCLMLSLADFALKGIVEIVWKDSGFKVESTDGFLMVKIFRLARLARLVRTLRFRFFHELKIMVLGVVSGLRVLTWAIVLLVVLVYVVGVAMTNLVGKEEMEFSSVQASMFTLFRCWTEGCAAYDGTPLAERLRAHHGFVFMVFHILMTMFVTVGVFNLIMAIFIDNVVTTQVVRKVKEMGEKSGEIELRLKKLFISYIHDGTAASTHLHKSMYRRVWQEVGAWRNNETKSLTSKVSSINEEWERLRSLNVTVTRDAFKAWLLDQEFMSILDEAEIETANHFELFDVLDADSGGELSMDELTNGLMKLRGPVTKADIVAVLLKVCNLTQLLESAVSGPVEQQVHHSPDAVWSSTSAANPPEHEA